MSESQKNIIENLLKEKKRKKRKGKMNDHNSFHFLNKS